MCRCTPSYISYIILFWQNGWLTSIICRTCGTEGFCDPGFGWRRLLVVRTLRKVLNLHKSACVLVILSPSCCYKPITVKTITLKVIHMTPHLLKLYVWWIDNLGSYCKILLSSLTRAFLCLINIHNNWNCFISTGGQWHHLEWDAHFHSVSHGGRERNRAGIQGG